MNTAKRKVDPAAARRRATVLGLVEERMRALIDAGIRPTVPALKAGLGVIGATAIRKARAELIAVGIVRIPGGLTSAPPAETAPPIEPGRAAARGLDDDGVAMAKGRRTGPFRKLIREALRRERAFAAWSRVGREGGAS